MAGLQVMSQLAERRLTRRRAAALLRLSERQIRRLYRAFRRDGAKALASRHRGRPSNRQLATATREQALTLVRERYVDFGPTFAHQKLTEQHGLAFSVETLRGWMTAAGLWVPRAQRLRRSQPPRPRRACLGELVQIDGSEHAWFEDRGPVCTLLVYVDDATSRLMELAFAEVESTFDYFRATRRYLERHGKPMAFYSDRLSVFHVQARDRAQGGPGLSQFGRALRDLNIDSLCANSPQAKGRVERANGTLQDRLVKELRLRVSPPRPPPSPSSRSSWRTTIAASPRRRGSPTMRIGPCSRVRTSPRSSRARSSAGSRRSNTTATPHAAPTRRSRSARRSGCAPPRRSPRPQPIPDPRNPGHPYLGQRRTSLLVLTCPRPTSLRPLGRQVLSVTTGCR